MLTNLIEGDIDQTHPLPPLEQLAEHLRDLIRIHWENDCGVQNRLVLAGIQSDQDLRSLFLKKSVFVSGGKSGAKSYMLFTLAVSNDAEAVLGNEIFGLEFTVRSLNK